MEKITRCLNEWNAIIEALGTGKQSILIRTYNTSIEKFLLYPTITYANKENILDSFKLNYSEFIKDNFLPDGENKIYKIKYYATIEEIVNCPQDMLDNISKFHIWTNKHVKNYLGKKNARIWILRVYKLNQPQMLARSKGMIYANVEKPVKLEGTPIIPDN